MQNERIYAVSDIHGDLNQLHWAHDMIARDLGDPETPHRIIHIGDLIDRREDSRGTIQYLMDGQATGKPWVVLKGNHDRLMEWFFDDPHRHDPHLKPDYSWLHHRIGGVETLESYGMSVGEDYRERLNEILEEAKLAVPQSHIDYIRNLDLFFETDDVFFVHAGVNLDRPLNDQTETDMVWIRENWLDNPKPAAKLILHGHTIVEEVTHYGNRVNIDTGAAWGDKLSVVEVVGREIYNLTEDGRLHIKAPD